MVQSVCLTSRGSGVRLPLLPPKTKEQPVENLAAPFFMGNLRICLKVFIDIKIFKQILILFAETAVLFIGDRLKPFI